jgi:hypothetical protein
MRWWQAERQRVRAQKKLRDGKERIANAGAADCCHCDSEHAGQRIRFVSAGESPAEVARAENDVFRRYGPGQYVTVGIHARPPTRPRSVSRLKAAATHPDVAIWCWATRSS